MISRTPASRMILVTAIPAAPRPITSTRSSSRRRPVSFTAFSNAAITTTAVPCWSSWKTGMSSSCCRRSSISKQRGAEMSSRLIPPKPGAISFTVRTISSGSLVSRQIGKASTPANSLNRHALPSITGIAAAGPMSPRPSTAVPSETTATVLRLIVYCAALAGSSRIAMHTRATPGVYTIERSSRVFSECLLRCSILPPTCSRKVRSVVSTTSTPGIASIVSRILPQCSRLAASTTMSLMLALASASTRSTPTTTPPASPIAPVRSPTAPGAVSSSRTRIVSRYCALGVMLTESGSWIEGCRHVMRKVLGDERSGQR